MSKLIILIFVIAILYVIWYLFRSQKPRAIRYFRIYKQFKAKHPDIKEREIYQETARLYYKSYGWSKKETEEMVAIVFNGGYVDEEKDIKKIASLIMLVEYPRGELKSNKDLYKYKEALLKEQSDVEWAYKKIFS